MSNHFTGLSLGPPLGDQRLDLCDLYAFQSPADPARTVLILNANPNADALHPDAIYRLAIDNEQSPAHNHEAVTGYAKEIGLDMAKFEKAYDEAAPQVASDQKQGDAAGADAALGRVGGLRGDRGLPGLGRQQVPHRRPLRHRRRLHHLLRSSR